MTISLYEIWEITRHTPPPSSIVAQRLDQEFRSMVYRDLRFRPLTYSTLAHRYFGSPELNKPLPLQQTLRRSRLYTQKKAEKDDAT
jgi:hypothetical protein